MKRTIIMLYIITFSFVLCSCESVKLTSADELVGTSWYIKNENSICAELFFDTTENKATMIITDQNEEKTYINGVYAIDKEKLYITSDTLFKTYSFDYWVFKDKLILSYKGEKLAFETAK